MRDLSILSCFVMVWAVACGDDGGAGTDAGAMVDAGATADGGSVPGGTTGLTVMHESLTFQYAATMSECMVNAGGIGGRLTVFALPSEPNFAQMTITINDPVDVGTLLTIGDLASSVATVAGQVQFAELGAGNRQFVGGDVAECAITSSFQRETTTAGGGNAFVHTIGFSCTGMPYTTREDGSSDVIDMGTLSSFGGEFDCVVTSVP